MYCVIYKGWKKCHTREHTTWIRVVIGTQAMTKKGNALPAIKLHTNFIEIEFLFIYFLQPAA